MRPPPLLLLTIAGIAHAAPALTVQSLPYQGEDQSGNELDAGAINMAWLSGDSPAARQINDFLFLQRLGSPAPKQVGKVLSAKDGIAIDSLTKQKFVVLRNDERILSIKFDIEFCGGADCTDYTEAYSFDSKSGRALSADDLFTPTRKTALARRFNAHTRDIYRKEVAELKTELKRVKANAAGQEKREALQFEIEQNQQCLDNTLQHAPRPDPTAYTATATALAQFDGNLSNYYALDKIGVVVHMGACFSHAMRDADDVGEVELSVPYQKLPELTPYGQALLLAQGTVDAPDNVYGPLLHGHIGDKAAITMLLDKDRYDGVSGFYYYEKYRKPLRLKGDLKDGVLTLEESASEAATDHPTLTLRAQGGRLVGTWSGQNALPVDVGP